MQTQRSITICNRPLAGLRHICCFYGSPQELQTVFLPYLREGLTAGEQVVCIFPSGEHSQLRTGLLDQGVDMRSAEEQSQLQFLTENETYISGGMFAKDRMANMLRDVLEQARSASFPYVRTLGEMSWALKNLPGTDDLVDYEYAVNELCSTYDCTLACAYDVNAFHGRVIADALSTHSHIVLNGMIFENPHYLSPQEFKKFMARRKSGAGPLRAGSDK